MERRTIERELEAKHLPSASMPSPSHAFVGFASGWSALSGPVMKFGPRRAGAHTHNLSEQPIGFPGTKRKTSPRAAKSEAQTESSHARIINPGAIGDVEMLIEAFDWM